MDGKEEPDNFLHSLQTEIGVPPTQNLLPFLIETLPELRLAAANKEFTIRGVRAPASASTNPYWSYPGKRGEG